LALVSVLQFAENLSDRAAADAVRTRIAGGGGGEGAGVDQAAGTDGKLAAYRLKVRAGRGGGVPSGQSIVCGMRHQALPSLCGWAMP
jgi:hypothetical protein